MKRILLAALAASTPLSALGHDENVETLRTIETATFKYTREPNTQARFSLNESQWEVRRGAFERGTVEWFRGYARFEVPETEPIRSARVHVPIYYGQQLASADGFAPAVLSFHEVHPFDLETARLFWNVGSSRVWDDMGEGDLYGVLDASWDQANHYLPRGDYTFELTPRGVERLNEDRGDDWVIGARFAREYGEDVNYTSLRCDGFSCYFELELTYGPPRPVGDFDGSERVDQADLDFVLLNWGAADQDELDAVLLTWGEGQQPLAAAAVPEPSTVALALLVSVGLAPLGRLAAQPPQIRRA